MPLKFMHLLDSSMLEAYRDKILLEQSFYSQKNTDIRFFLPQCRKTNLSFWFLRYLFMIFKQKQSVGKRTDLQQFEIFLRNSVIIVENLSFRTIFFELTKRYIPWETRWRSSNSTQLSLLSMAYYSKASMHCVMLIYLFQRRTAESLLENQLKNINLVPLK